MPEDGNLDTYSSHENLKSHHFSKPLFLFLLASNTAELQRLMLVITSAHVDSGSALWSGFATKATTVPALKFLCVCVNGVYI
jgi:hypothetical protein